MNRLFHLLFALLLLSPLTGAAKAKGGFVTIDGPDLRRPDGTKLFIQGTNLGNWLNPEGYMFGFGKTSSYWLINDAFCQMVGPDATARFWRDFKDKYITRRDIELIARTGANTIRLPFNYKHFTDEDYMGLTHGQDGFRLVDSVVSWCRDNNLYLILDMHDCPGGQTGDNIDNSYGYPWLFESEESQQLFCRIWRDIARRYRNEPVILGYELMNEPIAHYFKDDLDRLNAKLLPLYKRATRAIREVDRNHIILLGGAQWNGNFKPLTDWTFDSKLMFTCHRYGSKAVKEAYQDFIDYRDRTGLPMYMGETGHNTMEWQTALSQILRENNIGYTFWPYKKVDHQCWNAITRPEGWDSVVVRFVEADRSTYQHIREARPDQQQALRLMQEFLRNVDCARCTLQPDYIRSMGLKAE